MAEEIRTGTFHERFDIDVGVDEARRRFVNRVSNNVFSFLESPPPFNPAKGADREHPRRVTQIHRHVANVLGEKYDSLKCLDSYVVNDFYRCLQTLEAVYLAVEDPSIEDGVSDRIDRAIRSSEIDLGIDWQRPQFVRTGARLLDEKLVNEQLRWLSDPKYRTVYRPFQKGLSHFLESEQKPQLLGDVITDMYKALEALFKIVTGRPNKDLSANREMFVSKVKVSDQYKTLLKDYIAYANEFRHAEREQKPRPSISRPEAESFVYLTGLFIRLAVERS
ncbi:MAG: hypothetical protein H0T57_06280 [Rubrobacter sp.]|nr:hypothetical protein [Rubrobacter sp.]